MANFGVGIYVLFVIWFLTLLFCWVSVRTGHYIGKISVVISVIITIVLVLLPKGDELQAAANFYDKSYIPRVTTLSCLILSLIGSLVYCFITVCLTPVRTRKVKDLVTNSYY